jgi:hypothetical protein
MLMGARMEGMTERLEIDQGFRAWYAACPCCLSENHPQVKATLDRERRETASLRSDERGSDSK